MNNLAKLSQFEFFSDISPDSLAELESFSVIQNYEKGAVVFKNNEPAKNLYCLTNGEVDLAILFKEEIVTKDVKYEEYISTNVEILEKPITIEKVKTGDIFGWSALVTPEKMTATASCTKDCEILLIPANDLRKVFSDNPELGYLLSSRISSIIAKRLNSRTEKLVETWCSLFDTQIIGTD